MKHYAKNTAYNVFLCHNEKTGETLEITKYDANFKTEDLQDFKKYCANNKQIVESNKSEFDEAMKKIAQRLNEFNHE